MIEKTKHNEFAFASGELFDREFRSFLRDSLAVMQTHSADGALVYVFMGYVNNTIRRWQQVTGKDAVMAGPLAAAATASLANQGSKPTCGGAACLLGAPPV